MGDLFHDSSSQQTSTNQQIGVSTRDVGGSVITAGAGAIVKNESLDPIAIDIVGKTAAAAINASSTNMLLLTQAYQKALSIVGETGANTAGGALQLAASGVGSGASVNPQVQTAGAFNPSTIIWAGIALIAVVLIAGKFGK